MIVNNGNDLGEALTMFHRIPEGKCSTKGEPVCSLLGLAANDEQLRAQGRVGQGVAAMALGKQLRVVSASYLEGEQDKAMDLTSLVIVTESGLAKKVLISEYSQKGWATAGVVSTDLQQKDHILLTMLADRDKTLLVIWSGENGEMGKVWLFSKRLETRGVSMSLFHGRKQDNNKRYVCQR